MRAKTIFIIIVSVLVTIILMKNTDEVLFWIFGDMYVPKLAVLGVMFLLGVIVGAMIFRPKSKDNIIYPAQTNGDDDDETPVRDSLSEEDRDYIN